MTSLLLGIFVPVAIVGWLIGYTIWRGLQMKELVECGVEVNAIVESKRVVRPGSGGGRRYKIVYRYTDGSGVSHSRTTVPTSDLFYQYDEGQTFPVVYSSKRPHICGRKDEVDAARAALSRR